MTMTDDYTKSQLFACKVKDCKQKERDSPESEGRVPSQKKVTLASNETTALPVRPFATALYSKH